uniref:Large proline-rich protein bag6-like isoform X1 n=3 Tax=Rhizophora mucronata TaxID=61149 RepID=A0A2P2KVP4_RHIMU
MGSHGTDTISAVDGAGGSETMIEIKIKTLDSQTYTLRVDKQVPVPALKEQIASVTGVLSEQQRLICRGRVLKDDQLLSAYHVEDGHTLHLVVRQPIPPSSEGLPNHSAADPAPSTVRGYSGHVGPNVVIETLSMPEQGDGVPPEIGRIVSAVLGSFGFSNMASGIEGVDVARERLQQRTPVASVTLDATELQSEQSGIRAHSERQQSAFGLPTAVSLGPLHPPVLSDSLTTLSQYLSHIRREFDAIMPGRGRENSASADSAQMTEQRVSSSASQSVARQERLPTPEFLAEVLLSSRQMLTAEIAECLLQLSSHLESQANLTDPMARMSTQSNAWRIGLQLHNLGACLLELGRTCMTLRLGQAPSEAIVNAGPAIYINPSGPNPLMVQALPYQPGANSGVMPLGSVQPGSAMVNGIGTGFVPRRIDIQIRRGSSTSAPNANREERSDSQQPSGQGNPVTGSGSEQSSSQTFSRVSEGAPTAGESGVRVVPIRTMVAAVPGPFSHLPSESSGNSIGLYGPVVGRFQHVATGLVSAGQGSQSSNENSAGVQNEHRLSTPEAAVQQQNIEVGDGSRSNSNLRQQEPSPARNINVNVLSTGGTQNYQGSQRQIHNSVMHLLRNLFPSGDIQVQDVGLQGTATSSVPEDPRASTSSVEAQVTDEGIFLSNLLREIMPRISQSQGAESGVTSSGEAQAPEHQMGQESSTQVENSDVGTFRHHSNTEQSPPSSKRQKTE